MDAIKTHFAKTVDDYDVVSDKVVFKNDEVHDELISAIDFDIERQFSLLDSGCGTGKGMKMVAEKFPNSKITGIDFSSKMIEKSKKLLSFSKNVELLEIDFNDYEFDQKYDVVISAIAIHNSTDEQKEVLFKKIFNSLNENGLFINADFYKHESEQINNEIKNIYRNYLKRNLEGDELKVWLRHAFEEDAPMSLSEQELTLRNLGFSKFELKWLFNNEAVYAARKNS